MVQKAYTYKIYKPDGTYVGAWPDVISRFAFPQEVNSAGPQITIELGRDPKNFGYGVDIGKDYKVKVICEDADAPNGQTLFNGYIEGWKPVYGEGKHVEVHVRSYGLKLDTYPLQNERTTTPFYKTDAFGYGGHNSAAMFGQSVSVGVSFCATGKLVRATATVFPDYFFLSGGGTPGTLEGAIYTRGTDGRPANRITDWIPATEQYSVTKDGPYEFDFSAAPADTRTNDIYWLVVRAPTASGVGWQIYETLGYNPDPRTNMILGNGNGDGGWGNYWNSGGYSGTGNKLIAEFYNDATDTTVVYDQIDTGAMLRDIMDRYISLGGELSYDTTTIELTGKTESYTFNTNSIYEAIQVCLRLSPVGWYWYIDHATNMVHFHRQKPQQVDHKFVLGRHIKTFEPEQVSRNTYNTVYFTGAPGYFWKFVNEAALALNGGKPVVYRMSDGRVSSEKTAKALADSFLDAHVPDEIRTTVEILDTGVAESHKLTGYDIESVKLGQMIGFDNFGGSRSSVFDIFILDTDYLDGAPHEPDTYVLQVVNIEYAYDKIKLNLSTQPVDFNKVIDNLNRELTALQTVENPAAPIAT